LGERLHGVEEPLPGEDRIADAIDRNQDVYVQPDIGGNGDGGDNGGIGDHGDNRDDNGDERDQFVHENPFFAQFAEFQRFQAFMRAQQPIPRFGAVPFMGHMQQQQHPLIDPGSMVAMAQVRPPTLEGLNIKQIKTFKLAYRRYVSKVPVPQWIRLPGQLVLPEQLITIATLNNIGDIEDLKRMPEEQFFMCLCRIHNATMTTQWCRLLEQVKMTTQTWSLEFYLEYVEDFRFQMAIAGRDFQPPESEVVKIFIRGLQPNTLQTEIRRKNLETLEEVIDETSDVIVRYKAIFD
jgi:hypothetical protein